MIARLGKKFITTVQTCRTGRSARIFLKEAKALETGRKGCW